VSHSIPLITTLATAFGLALLFGFLAARLKLPVLVGYLFAGMLIGPYTPGFVANGEIARELAEIGVMLLMFGVGLHFSFSDLIAVWRIALPGAILQIIIATVLGAWVATTWGWGFGGSIIFGLSLSVASTVVLLRALEVHNRLKSISGRIAVGWLVVEDLVMVIVIVLLPPLAAWLDGKLHSVMEKNLIHALVFTLVKISAFITLMMVMGRKIFPKILAEIAQTDSRELFTLCVITTAITIAFIASKLFDVSFAMGAFFSGMMMRESPLSHRAVTHSLPLREAFAVLFFVSVGMLFDPLVLINHLIQLLTVVGIIVFGKTIIAIALLVCFRYPLNTALLVSVSLAQIGEFSFILAGLGVNLGLLPASGQSLILAGALISIAINPVLFKIINLICLRKKENHK
jgi:CPA2 family monovalent cation:H+ antiporter-2